MKLSVNWMEGYGNSPYFVLEGSRDLIPELKSCEMQFHDGLWVHVAPNGFVRYFAHSGKDINEGGYGGASFTFLHNGEERTVRGPWSSRAGCVNERGYNVVDVVLRDPKGGCGVSACITFALLMQLLDEYNERMGVMADFCVVLDTMGEPVYYPSIMPGCVMKPSGQLIDEKIEFQTVWEPSDA